MYVGKKLRALRLQLDKNQDEMAEALEVSRSYYSAIETGKRKITNKMLDKIEHVFGYSKENFKKTGDEGNLYPERGVIEGGKERRGLYPKNVPSIVPQSVPSVSKDKYNYVLYHKNMQKVNVYIKQHLPESEGYSDDLIDIFSCNDLLNALHDTVIGDIIFFGVDNISKVSNLKEFKEIGLTTYKKAIPYRDLIHEFANNTRDFMSKLKLLKDEIELNFDFDSDEPT